jgi:hypothetical protein
MSVWPEERLRERVEHSDGPVRSEVADLLAAFGARRFTDRACRNIERALSQVGLEANPSLSSAGPSGHVEISAQAPGSATDGPPETGEAAPDTNADRPPVEVAGAPPSHGFTETADRPVQIDLERVRAAVLAASRSLEGVVQWPRPNAIARMAAPLAIAIALIAVVAVVASSSGRSNSASPARSSPAAATQPRAKSTPAAPRAPAPNPLQRCAARWNAPGNAGQRGAFDTAARNAAAGTSVVDNALVLRYSGTPIQDVGVGVAGVNLEQGDCVVVHPSNLVFAFTGDGWQQIGVSPGTGITALATRAARAPNARVDGAGRVTLLVAQSR